LVIDVARIRIAALPQPASLPQPAFPKEPQVQAVTKLGVFVDGMQTGRADTADSVTGGIRGTVVELAA
jgi:hypothetical protein